MARSRQLKLLEVSRRGRTLKPKEKLILAQRALTVALRDGDHEVIQAAEERVRQNLALVLEAVRQEQ